MSLGNMAAAIMPDALQILKSMRPLHHGGKPGV
jgi:hypothetical protein